MNSEFLTAEQAARRAGVSRPTVSRALKFGDLRGNRDNMGRWSISPDDLDAWAEKRGPVQLSATNTEHSESFERIRTDLAQAREAVARAEARAETLAETVDDLRKERDRLLSALEARASRGFWARLFNRNG